MIATLELVGGIALILGVLTRVFAALLALNMLGALVLVHAPAGVFAATGGYELVLLLAAAALAVALVGAGKSLRGQGALRPAADPSSASWPKPAPRQVLRRRAVTIGWPPGGVHSAACGGPSAFVSPARDGPCGHQ